MADEKDHEETEHVHHEHHEKHHKDDHEKTKKHPDHEGHAHTLLASESKDLRDMRVSTMVFALAGAGIGGLSFLLNMDAVSIIIGIAVLAGLVMGMKGYLKRKTKFFMGSIFIYIFIWLVSWVFLYNLVIPSGMGVPF